MTSLTQASQPCCITDLTFRNGPEFEHKGWLSSVAPTTSDESCIHSGYLVEYWCASPCASPASPRGAAGERRDDAQRRDGNGAALERNPQRKRAVLARGRATATYTPGSETLPWHEYAAQQGLAQQVTYMRLPHVKCAWDLALYSMMT